MTNEQWKQVKDIFSTAIDLPIGERFSFIEEKSIGDKLVSKEVRALLESDEEAADFIEKPAVVVTQLVHDSTALVGKKIGSYLIEKEIGRGGMGAVYLAWRADEHFEKRVAIKLIKRGFDTDDIIRRFRYERQILAALDHPNITRLLDGGTTEDGLPFLVMDYVEGLPLTRYCKEKKLSLHERLNLFLQICSAVTYAHQNLIIHRDIKPSNILVTPEGTPKLLDFGIAKLTAPDSQQTFDGQTFQVMTPEYASPEQILGQNVTTATDIYSLGVILYELLTDNRPFRAQTNNSLELAKIVTESSLVKPSSIVGQGKSGERNSAVSRQLRGDLDNIILTAMRKEPERRYSSVEQFASDIQNYLKGLPVAARQDTVGYRASKFVNRNKTAVVAGAGIIAALVGGLAAAKKQANIARKQRDKAEQINRFLQKMLASADPRSGGKDAKVIEMLGKAAESLETDFADQLDVAADLETTVGLTYLSLGQNEAADKHLNNALNIRLKLFPHKSPEVAISRNNYGKLLKAKGNFDCAEILYRQALEIFRQTEKPAEVAEVLGNLGYLLAFKGENREAIKIHAEELEIRRSLFGTNDPNVAKTLGNLAIVLALSGENERAESYHRQSLAVLRNFYPEDHPDVVQAISRLAASVLPRDKNEAERLFYLVLELRRKSLGEAHPEVASTLYDLAFLSAESGDFFKSEKLARKILTMRGSILTDDHPTTRSALLILGRSLLGQNQPEKAKPVLEECLALREKSLPENHWLIATARSFYGECLTVLGETRQGRNLLFESYEILRNSLGINHAQTLAALERKRRFFS